MSFAPLTSANADLHRRQLAETANEAKRGETANTGRFTAPAGSESFTLEDARLGVGKALLLCPENAAAATSGWHVPSVLNGRADISFTTALPSDAAFAYAVAGEGNTRGV